MWEVIKFQGCVRYGTYRGIPPVFPPVYTLPSVSVRSVQASIPYRKFRYARYSPPYPTENLGIRRKNTESSVGVPVRPPYPTENLGTLGIDLHTLPKISVRSVQPSYPTENLGIRRENTESSVGVSVQPHTLPKEIQIAVQCAVPLPFPKHTTLLLHPPTEHHHPPWGTRYRALMSSEATSQDEGGASGANPGSGGSSSSQAPTPEVAEISQGNSVATISPAIVYNKLGQVYDVQHETTKAVDDFAVPAGYRRVGTREASFMYSVGVYVEPISDNDKTKAPKYYCLANATCRAKKLTVPCKGGDRANVNKHLKKFHDMCGKSSVAKGEKKQARANTIQRSLEASKNSGAGTNRCVCGHLCLCSVGCF